MKFTATPVITTDRGDKRYRLGFGAERYTVGKLPFWKAFDESLAQNKKYSLLIVDMVRKMLRNEASIKQMEGPIGIARAAGQVAQQPGWSMKLEFLSAISLNLGIFNLLPIPILDGGMILLLMVETASCAGTSASESRNASTKPPSCSWCCLRWW